MSAGTLKSGYGFKNRFLIFKRKRLYPLFQDFQWPLIGAAWVTALTLGFVGFRMHALSTGTLGAPLDHLYRTIQLLVLQSGDVTGPVPWPLETARFLLPLLAGYTAVNAFLSIFRYQWQLFRTRFTRNHLVICGLGERGFKLAEDFLEHGYQVIVIEKDRDNKMLERVRRLGAIALVGDAADPAVLNRARIKQADYLITVCADDGLNAEIALRASAEAGFHRKRTLTAFIHIYDLDLCNLLGAWSLKAASANNLFRIELFNVPSSGARLMLKEYKPFDSISEQRQIPPHLLVVGLGKMGRSVVAQAAREWWHAQDKERVKFEITLVDREVDRKLAQLLVQLPGLNRVCSVNTLKMETGSPEFEMGDFIFDKAGQCRVTRIYICLDDDQAALACALKLCVKTAGTAVPVIVRMRSRTGLAGLVGPEQGVTDFSRVHPFNVLKKTCSLEAILGGTHEILARAVHESYVRHQLAAGDSPRNNPSMVGWDCLPVELKESNRRHVARIEEKLRTIGCSIQPLADWESASFSFTPGEIEVLAREEHERWREERLSQGWAYGGGPKNMVRKTSPHLVDWERLDEETREFVREAVRDLSSILARVGLQVYRKPPG